MNKIPIVSIATQTAIKGFAALVLVMSLLILGLMAITTSSVLSGCSAESTYVKADSLTYKAVAPIQRAYVENDTTIDEDTKRRRINILDLWRARIERHDEDPENGAVPSTGPPSP